jgi:hypothetical protein
MRAILLASATATTLKGRDVGRKTRFWVMRSRPARSDSEFLYYLLRIDGRCAGMARPFPLWRLPSGPASPPIDFALQRTKCHPEERKCGPKSNQEGKTLC